MYRIIKMHHEYHACKIESIKQDSENIKDFVESGTPVIIVDDLEELIDIDIDIDIEKIIIAE